MIGTSFRRSIILAGKTHAGFLRHIGWNLSGQGAPLLAALVSIPVLIRYIGIDRFGILTIAWMLIGYFSLFDLGIGRAMTQLIAEKLARDQQQALPQLIWTGLSTMFGFGIIGAALLAGLSGWAVYHALNIPSELQRETLHSLYLLAPAIPMVVVSTGLRGILEARLQFRSVNLVRIPLGVLMFAAPLCVLPWTNSLVAIVGMLLLVRFGTLLALGRMCWNSLEHFRRYRFDRAVLPELLKFGGWMTVSNIISPVMVQMDRFVIGAVLSMAAVAYYAAPFEMITKVLLIPTAISGVAFPSFARLLARQDIEAASKLYWNSIGLSALGILPVVVIVYVFADPLLQRWLHGAFPAESGVVLRILAVGVLLNGLAHIPFAYLQGAGRAHLTAKLHLAEVPFYLAALTFAVPRFGIVGAAAVWTLRVAVDAVLMHMYSDALKRSLTYRAGEPAKSEA